MCSKDKPLDKYGASNRWQWPIPQMGDGQAAPSEVLKMQRQGGSSGK